MKLTKQEALKKIDELKSYVNQLDVNDEWVKIDYSVIDKEIFDKYGAKPFEIMKRKMRNENGKVMANINYKQAQDVAKKQGYRLPTIQEMLVLLEAYKKEKGNNVSHHDKEFLGIEELSYNEDVCYEFVAMNDDLVFLRGFHWGARSNAGVFSLYLDWSTGDSATYVGFRCVR